MGQGSTGQGQVANSFTPYLSVVAASRNDDHGGAPLERTKIFIRNFALQCEKYRLPAELILVDWNPVSDRPGLAAVLGLPPGTTYCQAWVITVPASLHQRLKYADHLPLFQMIAKNVGILRARAKFILATNIDIIFSNELIDFIARQKLDPKKVYRVDRTDIPAELTDKATLDEVLGYAWANPVRCHRRSEPKSLLDELYGNDGFTSVCRLHGESRRKQEFVEVLCDDGIWQVQTDPIAPFHFLHINGCGDFTLLSRDGWKEICGYPEFEAFSFNIDSMGLAAAHYGGYEEVSLLPPCVCFHMEHESGSGWTPEGKYTLLDRLRKSEILTPEWPVLLPLVDQMREQRKCLKFNYSRWGLADFELPVQALGDTTAIPSNTLAQLALTAESREVSAIQPTYDLDRLTLAHERRLYVNGYFPVPSSITGP